MPANYVLLEKITVGAAGASSVTFSSIPQTGYTDLVIKTSIRTDQSGVNRSFKVQPNGVDITARRLGAEGTPTFAAYSDTGIGIYAVGSGATSSTFDNVEIYIPNYASTSTYKSISIDAVNENNGTDSGLMLNAGLYSSNSAITSVTLLPTLGSFVQYSTFYLYGVAKLGTTPAIVPYATGGDTIMTDGTYWYHAFKSSGTFTPAKGLSCDVLVVAGGGGGGWYAGGGGGAGGLYYSSSNSVTTTGYTVTVGAGGNGRSTSGVGSNGSNSVFGALTAAVGGGGGGGVGASGGSGGGGGGLAANSGGSGTSGQGNAGGSASGTTSGAGGSGGGGAGAVGGSGTNPPNETPGAGGAGVNTYSSWLSTTGMGVSGYIAGGGGGSGGSPGQSGAGGSGGGGAGGSGVTLSGTSGTANTGGGGGGGWYTGTTSGNGGSGIVIVRYAV